MFIETLTASANKYETRNRKASKSARLAVKYGTITQLEDCLPDVRWIADNSPLGPTTPSHPYVFACLAFLAGTAAGKHVARQAAPATAETAIRPNLQNPTWRNTSNDEKRDLIMELVSRITDPDDLERLYKYANRLFCSK